MDLRTRRRILRHATLELAVLDNRPDRREPSDSLGEGQSRGVITRRLNRWRGKSLLFSHAGDYRDEGNVVLFDRDVGAELPNHYVLITYGHGRSVPLVVLD